MEDTLQQEKLEQKSPNEEQGGIRRRLRDRDLLRKRKAEAEEKETNQVESQRKRPRAEDKSGAKKRGRPRKAEQPTPEISAIQEEAAAAAAAATPQETPPTVGVVVVSEPAEVTPVQTSSSLSPLLAVGSKPAPVPTGPAYLPLFGSPLRPMFGPSLVSPSVPAPAVSPAKVLDAAPILIQDLAPAPDAAPAPAPSQAPAPAAPPAAPPQVETLYIESQGREALDQVLIEDLGPDEEEDISLSEDKKADEDLSGTSLMNVPEQNKMFSVPTLSSQPPPQEYLPGNSF